MRSAGSNTLETRVYGLPINKREVTYSEGLISTPIFVIGGRDSSGERCNRPRSIRSRKPKDAITTHWYESTDKSKLPTGSHRVSRTTNHSSPAAASTWLRNQNPKGRRATVPPQLQKVRTEWKTRGTLNIILETSFRPL